ncbi:MAG TPA: hypothetical protein ENI29_16895 [bacterium]|nr:hypothetical protein [bacterium]
MRVAFFRCPKCHTWRYSTKGLERTRKYTCLSCKYRIDLDKVSKEIYEMPNRQHLKTKVLQEIKARGKKL